MLQAFREKFSGWVLVVIVLLLAVPFALFGINNYFEATVESYVAKVNEAEITSQQLQERLDAQRNQMRQMLGQDAALDFLNTPENKRRILDSLVDEELRYQDGKAAGIEVPVNKLRQDILAMEVFKVDGKFDERNYVSVLRANNMTPQMFQQRMSRDLVSREIPARLGGSVFVTDADVDNYIRLNSQMRSFAALRMKAADEVLAQAPNEEAIAKYFEDHKAEFNTPEMVTLEYVEIVGADLKVDPADEVTLTKRYEELKDRFVVPEQRLASHVLVEVAAGADADAQKAALAKAEALYKEIKDGKPLADVAKASSDDQGSKAQGGDLGWLERGASDAAFDEALFKLEANQVSEPVLGANGYHIIQLREIRPESRRQFAEVRGELESEHTATERERVYSDLAGQLVDAIQRDPLSLSGPASTLKLEVKRTEPFARTGGAGIAANPDVIKEAFSELVLDRSQTSDLIDVGPDHSVAIRAVERKAPEPRTLEAVRGEIEAKLRSEAQRAQLAAKVADLEKRLIGGEALDAIAKSIGKTIEKAEGAPRTATTPDPAIVAEVFKLPRPSAEAPVRKAIKLSDDDYALVDLTSVFDADPKSLDGAGRDAARSALQTQWTEAESAAYLAALRKNAVITIAEDRM
jgi:peptidyl-prolyl cis-trans isomerase D